MKADRYLKLSQESLKRSFHYADGLLWRAFSAGPRPVLPITGKKKTWYQSIKIEGRSYLLHRVIWTLLNGDIPDGMQIDHIDGNKSNNRVENLRLATRSQNLMNTGTPQTNTSGYKGVHWSKSSGKWLAKIKRDQEVIRIGLFDDPRAAHDAYQMKAKQLFGDFAREEHPPSVNSGDSGD